jgi:hypothetical protein
MLGDRFLRQARRFPRLYNHLSECLHFFRCLPLCFLQEAVDLSSTFICYAVPFGSLPDPVRFFRDYQGLYGPFWDYASVSENGQNSLILQENQALSR